MKEKLMEVKNEAQAIFNLIQRIDAPMTENNVVVMNACLGSVKFVYNRIGVILKGSEVNGNADAE